MCFILGMKGSGDCSTRSRSVRARRIGLRQERLPVQEGPAPSEDTQSEHCRQNGEDEERRSSLILVGTDEPPRIVKRQEGG